MKKFFLTFLMLIFFVISYSQVAVIKSNKIITENGLTYYLHTVEQGQTIYGLTKAYGISEALLLKTNPELIDGLKVGQEIKILKEEIAVDMGEPKKEVKPVKNQSYIEHKVETGETLYKITKQYQISQEELIKHNPGLTTDLQIGQIIKIPSQNPFPSNPANNYVDYTVKKRDNYSKLSRKFKTNQSELESINPTLTTLGLQEGMVIKIPYKEGIDLSNLEEEIIEIKTETNNIETQPVRNQEFEAQPISEKSKFKPTNKTYKIGLMMPFYSNLESEIRTDNEFFMKSQENYQSFKYIQYYEGFLMAIDSMKARGFNAEIFIYDTKADTNTTINITKKPEFQDLNLIIGPFFARNLKIVVPLANNNNTMVASPFTSGAGLESFNNLFIIETNNSSLWNEGMKYAKDSLGSSSIYILHSGKASEYKEINQIKNAYKIAGGDTTKFQIYSTKEAGFKSLLNNLKTDKPNIIINLSENEAQISSFVRVLNQNRDKYSVVLMGREEQWRKFKTLEDEYLVNLRLTLLSPNFIDYRQSATIEFVNAFYKTYKIDPQPIAFKGYDDGIYFMTKLMLTSDDFKKESNLIKFEGIHSSYRFKNNGQGGWINTQGCVYQYYNYEVIDKKKPLIPYVKQTDKNSTPSQEVKPINPIE